MLAPLWSILLSLMYCEGNSAKNDIKKTVISSLLAQLWFRIEVGCKVQISKILKIKIIDTNYSHS